MTTLYVFKNVAGRVLYVGISEVAATRWGQHRIDKPWWREVASVDVSHYPSRRDAETAERTVIQALRPPYNVDHNPAVWSRRQYSIIHRAPSEGTGTKLSCCGLDYWQVPSDRITPIPEFADCAGPTAAEESPIDALA